MSTEKKRKESEPPAQEETPLAVRLAEIEERRSALDAEESRLLAHERESGAEARTVSYALARRLAIDDAARCWRATRVGSGRANACGTSQDPRRHGNDCDNSATRADDGAVTGGCPYRTAGRGIWRLRTYTFEPLCGEVCWTLCDCCLAAPGIVAKTIADYESAFCDRQKPFSVNIDRRDFSERFHAEIDADHATTSVLVAEQSSARRRAARRQGAPLHFEPPRRHRCVSERRGGRGVWSLARRARLLAQRRLQGGRRLLLVLTRPRAETRKHTLIARASQTRRGAARQCARAPRTRRRAQRAS